MKVTIFKNETKTNPRTIEEKATANLIRWLMRKERVLIVQCYVRTSTFSIVQGISFHPV